MDIGRMFGTVVVRTVVVVLLVHTVFGTVERRNEAFIQRCIIQRCIEAGVPDFVAFIQRCIEAGVPDFVCREIASKGPR